MHIVWSKNQGFGVSLEPDLIINSLRLFCPRRLYCSVIYDVICTALDDCAFMVRIVLGSLWPHSVRGKLVQPAAGGAWKSLSKLSKLLPAPSSCPIFPVYKVCTFSSVSTFSIFHFFLSFKIIFLVPIGKFNYFRSLSLIKEMASSDASSSWRSTCVIFQLKLRDAVHSSKLKSVDTSCVSWVSSDVAIVTYPLCHKLVIKHTMSSYTCTFSQLKFVHRALSKQNNWRHQDRCPHYPPELISLKVKQRSRKQDAIMVMCLNEINF